MKILIDDANPERIRELAERFPVAGVTTNPTILARAGGAPFDTLRAIRAFLGPEKELHVQTVAADRAGMIRDAERIVSELGEGTFVKIPCVPEGFAAMQALCRRGFFVTGTAVYSPMQALLAANCGARCVAPYVNRMDNMGYDGTATVGTIQRIFDTQGIKTRVLAASFKNTQQVLALAALGVASATLSPDVLENSVRNAAIDAAVADFTRDFEALCGAGRTMADC